MEFILQFIAELFGNTAIEENTVEEVVEEPVQYPIESEESENIFGLLNFH